MAAIPEALAIALQHHQAGQLQAAEQIYRQILQAQPNHADSIHLLGLIAHQVGKDEIAVEYIERAIRLNGSEAAFHNNLGNALKDLGKLEQAIACYRRALELNQDFAEAYNNLGTALGDRDELNEAIACYRRALQLTPEFVEAYNNLGLVLVGQSRFEEAVSFYRRALELKPDYAEVHDNMGLALQDQGKPDEAVACYEAALKLQPDSAGVHNNLGCALKDLGNLEHAIRSYRQALEFKPGMVLAHSNLLFTLQFCADQNVEAIHQEHLLWNQKFAEPLGKFIQPHLNDCTPNRRLRIGYVSPDLCGHPVGRFILPLLATHNHQDFEIVCYSSVHTPDPITEHCRAHADVWRDVRRLDDEHLAEVIRQDRIDILVDLSMHMANGRLLVFARKPAPLQVTYLAYCGTTGLSTIDYRLSDPYLDPPDLDRKYYSEQTVRLPETYWCYLPMPHATDENALPALQGDPITFGCLNNFAKVTVPTLITWCHILQAVPNSRLLLHAAAGSHRRRVREILVQHNVSPERLIFTEKVPRAEYFRLYQRIDVALDPFPYGGGTTTCDALWMGVPVVSLAGQTAVGRGGLSILSNVGLADLVASDTEQYVRIAVELAGDLVRLSQLRATLRTRMQSSPLMDAHRFARNIEAAYRTMWRTWCADQNNCFKGAKG